jgi:hypothetical protein
MSNWRDWHEFEILQKKYKDRSEWELLGPKVPIQPPLHKTVSKLNMILDTVAVVGLLFLFFVIPLAITISLLKSTIGGTL